MPHVLRAAVVILLVSLSAPALHAQEGPGEPWWRDRVFYEIFVRSFADSDGDGIGDFDGLTAALDYLNDGDPATTGDLGITGIWLMPITEGPSYHGYHVTDFRAVESDYGTLEDFQEFLAAAHERGIAVIVDFVINHVHIQHPWFVAAQDPGSPYEDWFIWSADDPGYRGPWGQEVWHPLGDRYFYGIFIDTEPDGTVLAQLPDLNLRNPQVTEEIYDIADFWLNEMGVDGFRLDAVKHLVEEGEIQANAPATHAWVQAFAEFLDEVAPEAFTVGEAFGEPLEVLAEYVAGGVDVGFNFPLAAAMIDSAQIGGARAVIREQLATEAVFPDGQYAAFLTNHDQDRLMGLLLGSVGKAKVAASLLLTQPGIPFIYYGEEIGMIGVKDPARGAFWDAPIRTPMQWDDTPLTAGFTTGTPWEPVQPNTPEVNVEAQIDDPDSLLSHYRTLIHLRNDNEALQSGDWLLIDSDSRDVYSFLRATGGQTLLVIINLEDEPVSEYNLLLGEAELAGFSEARLLFGEGDLAPLALDEYRPLGELAPHATYIIELE